MCTFCTAASHLHATTPVFGLYQDDVQIPFVTKLVTGAVAGIVGTCCVFPIDIVKTRLQNQRIGPGTPRVIPSTSALLWRC